MREMPLRPLTKRRARDAIGQPRLFQTVVRHFANYTRVFADPYIVKAPAKIG